MARLEHHSAIAFLIYYFIYSIWANPIIPGWAVFLIIFFGLLPDLDSIYWILKKGKMNTEFQHHLYYFTHWPLTYFPFIFIFIISFIFNIYPEYFIIPIIGIYLGHFIPDSIATGDGIMWGKIPWKKNRFAKYTNFFAVKTDGYHGIYWEIRFRKTFFYKLANIAVIFTIVLIILFQLISRVLNGFYIISICILSVSSLYGLRKISNEFSQEPPEGRYADYRTNLSYINGLSKKNKMRHYKKYSNLIDKK